MNVTGHYEEFDKSNLNKEDLTSFDKIKQNIEKIKQLWIKLGNKEYKKKVESILRKGFLYGDIKKAISSLEEEEE